MPHKDPAVRREKQRLYQSRHRAAKPEYYREKAKAQRAKIQDIIRKAKAVPCMDCGISYPYYVMDFDHRNADEKEYNIAHLTSCGSERKVLDEIAKCDVVCSNCHRCRTFQRAGVIET